MLKKDWIKLNKILFLNTAQKHFKMTQRIFQFLKDFLKIFLSVKIRMVYYFPVELAFGKSLLSSYVLKCYQSVELQHFSSVLRMEERDVARTHGNI